MKIGNKEVKLKITPKALLKIEEQYKDFDVLGLIRGASEDKEPRISDYYKLIYAGYLGAEQEEITFDEFLEMIEDVDIFKINKIGVELLVKRKN